MSDTEELKARMLSLAAKIKNENDPKKLSDLLQKLNEVLYELRRPDKPEPSPKAKKKSAE